MALSWMPDGAGAGDSAAGGGGAPGAVCARAEGAAVGKQSASAASAEAAPLLDRALACIVVLLAVHEPGRRGDEVVHRKRPEAELDAVLARPDLDAAEEQVRAQDRPPLAVHIGLPARVIDVVQDHDAVAVGLDRQRDFIAAVAGDLHRP